MPAPLLLGGAAVLAAVALTRRRTTTAAPRQHTPTVAGAPQLGAPQPFDAGGAAGKVGLVAAGLALADVQGRVVEGLTGSAGAGDTARLFGPLGTGAILAGEGARRAADALGLSAAAQKQVRTSAGLATAGALVLGAPAAVGVLGLKVGAEAVSAGIGWVAGAQTERAVRDTARQFDPTLTGSRAHRVVSTVTSFVKGWF